VECGAVHLVLPFTRPGEVDDAVVVGVAADVAGDVGDTALIIGKTLRFG
jgi:hypothetical protein